MEEPRNTVNTSDAMDPINIVSADNENSNGETNQHIRHNEIKNYFPLTQPYEVCIKY